MTQTVDIPVQMISCCSTDGHFTPMRFRYRQKDASLQTVEVSEILVQKSSGMEGVGELEYVCKSTIDNVITLFSLCYNVRTHRWRLAKIISG